MCYESQTWNPLIIKIKIKYYMYIDFIQYFLFNYWILIKFDS
jgi:hypothetical protein